MHRLSECGTDQARHASLSQAALRNCVNPQLRCLFKIIEALRLGGQILAMSTKRL